MALKAEGADVAIATSCRVNAGAPVPGVTNVAGRVALAPRLSPIGGWWDVQVWEAAASEDGGRPGHKHLPCGQAPGKRYGKSQLRLNGLR